MRETHNATAVHRAAVLAWRPGWRPLVLQVSAEWDSLNQWFWRNQQAGVSRTSIVCDPVTGAIVGYVSLCTGQIERAYLPKARQRNQPDPLPVILLGQLAVDRQYQGRGYARSLLWFALTTAWRLSKEVGCFGVLTHPLDDGLRQFYRRFGFEDLPGDPHRGMVVRMVDLERSGFGDEGGESMKASVEEFAKDFTPEARAEFAARIADLAGADARRVVRVVDLARAEIEAMVNGTVPQEYAYLDALLKDPQP